MLLQYHSTALQGTHCKTAWSKKQLDSLQKEWLSFTYTGHQRECLILTEKKYKLFLLLPFTDPHSHCTTVFLYQPIPQSLSHGSSLFHNQGLWNNSHNKNVLIVNNWVGECVLLTYKVDIGDWHIIFIIHRSLAGAPRTRHLTGHIYLHHHLWTGRGFFGCTRRRAGGRGVGWRGRCCIRGWGRHGSCCCGGLIRRLSTKYLPNVTVGRKKRWQITILLYTITTFSSKRRRATQTAGASEWLTGYKQPSLSRAEDSAIRTGSS